MCPAVVEFAMEEQTSPSKERPEFFWSGNSVCYSAHSESGPPATSAVLPKSQRHAFYLRSCIYLRRRSGVLSGWPRAEEQPRLFDGGANTRYHFVVASSRALPDYHVCALCLCECASTLPAATPQSALPLNNNPTSPTFRESQPRTSRSAPRARLTS